MKVIDPGHSYELDVLDRIVDNAPKPLLMFVKRCGEKYPGNAGAHAGVTTQEVLRALIERTVYVDAQIPHAANGAVLGHLRAALIALEERAAERRGERLVDMGLRWKLRPETEPTCPTCGHVRCAATH